MWYVYGNIAQATAVEIANSATSILKMTSVPKDELSDIRCIMLPPSGENCQRLDIDVIDKDNENSCLMTYF
jgi:hypothetical protein